MAAAAAIEGKFEKMDSLRADLASSGDSGLDSTFPESILLQRMSVIMNLLLWIAGKLC